MATSSDQELSFVSNFVDSKPTELYTPNGTIPSLEDDESYTFRVSTSKMGENLPRLALRDDYEVSDEDAPLIRPSAVNVADHHCHTGQAPMKNSKAQRQLTIACVVVLIFMIAEVIGGYFANSLAIMTDAAHMLSDFASFLISLFALWVATRPATRRMSFGYHRAEVIGAVVSVLIIWILTGVLVYMAIQRCIDQDYVINADIMILTAGCGVAVNIFLGCVLHQAGHGHSHGGMGQSSHSHGNTDRSSHSRSSNVTESQNGANYAVSHSNSANQSDSLVINDCEKSLTVSENSSTDAQTKKEKRNINVRAAFIHVLGDLIQSIGVLIAAYIIKYQPEAKIADPICTFLFSFMVLLTTLSILKDAMHVLMEGAPKDIDFTVVKNDLLSIEGVKMAHSLHIWSLTIDKPALAVHLAIDPSIDEQKVLRNATHMIRTKYHITRSTIQVEHFQPSVMASCVTCQGPSK